MPHGAAVAERERPGVPATQPYRTGSGTGRTGTPPGAARGPGEEPVPRVRWEEDEESPVVRGTD